jgi:hypothetical protein
VVLVGGILLLARVATAALLNTSFEQANTQTDLVAWSEFGNVFQEPVTPLTGTYSVKMFGNFTTDGNLSGIFQDVAAIPSEGWTAGVNVRHNAGDALTGNNRALLKLEFLNGSFTQISFVENTILTSGSALNTYTHHSAWAIAPAGTSWARISLLYLQDPATAGGAAFFDDASLVPEPSSMVMLGFSSLLLIRRRSR